MAAVGVIAWIGGTVLVFAGIIGEINGQIKKEGGERILLDAGEWGSLFASAPILWLFSGFAIVVGLVAGAVAVHSVSKYLREEALRGPPGPGHRYRRHRVGRAGPRLPKTTVPCCAGISSGVKRQSPERWSVLPGPSPFPSAGRTINGVRKTPRPNLHRQQSRRYPRDRVEAWRPPESPRSDRD